MHTCLNKQSNLHIATTCHVSLEARESDIYYRHVPCAMCRVPPPRRAPQVAWPRSFPSSLFSLARLLLFSLRLLSFSFFFIKIQIMEAMPWRPAAGGHAMLALATFLNRRPPCCLLADDLV